MLELILGTYVDKEKGDFKLPLSAVTKTFAILAKKGAGKTYTAGVMEEEMYENGIPFVVFDPIDVHWGLRLNRDGKSLGLKVVVFGVLDNADIQLTDNMGAQIAHAIVNKNISCIISTFGMSKKGMRKVITEFSEELLRINNTPRHIFIEEAHEYVPQRVTSDLARVFSAVEALVVMGRNRGLGVTLINQRAATLNKDVLTQVDTLLAFRNISPQDRKALQEWVEAHGSEENFEGFWNSLASLETGEGWVWSPEWLKEFDRVKIRERQTFHPNPESFKDAFSLPDFKESDIQDFVMSFGERNKDKEVKPIKKVNGIDKDITLGSRVKAGSYDILYYDGILKENKELKKALKIAENKLKSMDSILHPQGNSGGKVLVKTQDVNLNPRLEMWLQKLPKGAGNILQFLAEKHPLKFTRSQIALGIGVRIKTLNNNQNYISVLKRNDMVIEENGQVTISPDLL